MWKNDLLSTVLPRGLITLVAQTWKQSYSEFGREQI